MPLCAELLTVNTITVPHIISLPTSVLDGENSLQTCNDARLRDAKENASRLVMTINYYRMLNEIRMII